MWSKRYISELLQQHSNLLPYTLTKIFALLFTLIVSVSIVYKAEPITNMRHLEGSEGIIAKGNIAEKNTIMGEN